MSDEEVIGYLKGLVIDGVHKANSGHPGGAMSSMDFAFRLFRDYLVFAPEDPSWQGRDRFILSAGHESMLQYSLLYAVGWLKKEDLAEFRQLNSRTPGHPEVGVTPGVECTTGPLGQGAAMSVGFAVGASHRFKQMKGKIRHNRTWALLGDGCMQEGVTYAAASLAGHLGLDHLIWYYDRNAQQISGGIEKTYSDDPVKVFEGLGWNVLSIDAHHREQMTDALNASIVPNGKPTLIVATSIMAKGCVSLEGSSKTHGNPLPFDEREKTKSLFGIPDGEEFYFPEDAKLYFGSRFKQLNQLVEDWKCSFKAHLETDPGLDEIWQSFQSQDGFSHLPAVDWSGHSSLATRNAFGMIIEQYAQCLPTLIGGSADLEPSNMTGAFAKAVQDFSKDLREGRNIHFGVREFPMAAIANGLALFGGYIPFTATFLSFADYSRPAIRLGAIQKCRVIHELTHDSFYLGEDGPTHQPVEHLMSLRAMPDLLVMRPADAYETEVMFKQALTIESPSAICLTRQKLPQFSLKSRESDICKGAWSVTQVSDPKIVIFATGSEVSLALEVSNNLGRGDIEVISVPCWELFFAQDQVYINRILHKKCLNRVSIEAGATLGWERFTGIDGVHIGLDRYGESAPADKLAEKFGFTVGAVSARIKRAFL